MRSKNDKDKALDLAIAYATRREDGPSIARKLGVHPSNVYNAVSKILLTAMRKGKIEVIKL